MTTDRQEERWTATPPQRDEAGGLSTWVRDASGHHLVKICFADDDEGRATVAKMAAALQMEEALTAIQWGTDDRCPACAGWDCSPNGETNHAHTKDCPVRVALEAAKRLP